MSSYTKGPWQIRWRPRSRTAEIETVSQEDGQYRHITNDMPMCAGPGVERELVKDTEDEDGREYPYAAEACANARLIACAPDLLEACKAALSDGNTLNMMPCHIAQQIWAAIAKAEAE